MAARIEYKEIERGAWMGRETKKVGDDARVILITLSSMPTKTVQKHFTKLLNIYWRFFSQYRYAYYLGSRYFVLC